MTATSTEGRAGAHHAFPPVLFADRYYVVLDKPPGLKVHPGPGGEASVEDWFGALSRRADGPWLAHRLDADTAGCLLVALRKQALIEAQACFAEGRARKTYWAVVQGHPNASSGVIDAPLRRVSSQTSGWRMEIAPRGHPDAQPAETHWRVLGQGAGQTWLELRPRSGRTHQLRVHCAGLGMPLLGDRQYGSARGDVPMHLLSQRLELPLTPLLDVSTVPPPTMVAAFSACGWRSGV